MISIDKLCYSSRLRYQKGEIKFSYAVLTLLFCVVSRSPWVAALALCVNFILTVRVGGVPGRTYLHFLLVPLIFMVLSTLAIVVNVKEQPLDLFALSIGRWYLTGSRAGLAYALRLILTAMASVTCLYFLAMTTPMPDILNVLNRLRCPRILGELMLLIYRYIFVLLETAHAISVSQDSRLGNRDFRTSLKSFGALGSQLMVRAMDRSRALYNAMEARCYDGVIRVLSEERPWERKPVICLVLFEGLLLMLTIWRLFP